MRLTAWIVVGWLGTLLCSAFAARLHWAHVIPDVPVLVVVYLALHREPVRVAPIAAALGYLVGQQALAPIGLHETALVLCAVTMAIAAGSIAAGGALFYAAASAAAVVGYHLLLGLLVFWQRGVVGFSSWATALLLPAALATALLGLLLYPLFAALERRLTTDPREGLLWR